MSKTNVITCQLLLTGLYRSGSRWTGTYDVIDATGRTFGEKAFARGSREELESMHSKPCDQYGEVIGANGCSDNGNRIF